MDTQNSSTEAPGFDVEALKESGDIVECAACSELSAFAWTYVADKPSYNRGCYSAGEIAHVGSASCFGWECGHCGATNVEPDSPTLAEVYTHVSQEEREAAFS